MIATFTDRKFQLWEYMVSHGSLLLRSPKDLSHSMNIDLVFAGVEFVQLPRHLQGVELEEGTVEDCDAASKLASRPVDRVFILSSGGKRYMIAAAACKVEESERDIFDSPLA